MRIADNSTNKLYPISVNNCGWIRWELAKLRFLLRFLTCAPRCPMLSPRKHVRENPFQKFAASGRRSTTTTSVNKSTTSLETNKFFVEDLGGFFSGFSVVAKLGHSSFKVRKRFISDRLLSTNVYRNVLPSVLWNKKDEEKLHLIQLT